MRLISRTPGVVPHWSRPSRLSGASAVRSPSPSWASAAVDTAACTTRPSTTKQSPTSTTRCNTHSSATGEAFTRGGATRRLGSRASPTASNSLVPAPKSVPVALTCSNSSSGVRQTTNSPVASMLRRLSLRPTEVNCTTGGVTPATVKNECGARLSTPSAERDDTQAIGRGTTTEVSSL